MFTGIIKGRGIVKKFDIKTQNRSAAKMGIDLGNLAKGLQIGDSVAINGVCLTATHISKNHAEFEMIDETLKKTNLGMIKSGDKVNIERSLKVGERMEGHFVLGHIDGTGKIIKIEKLSKEIKFWIELPKDLGRFVVKKGSKMRERISGGMPLPLSMIFTFTLLLSHDISMVISPFLSTA